MSIASHQLRTPLTTIKNITLLLRDGRFGEVNSKQKDALQTSYRSIDQMVSLIQDFLAAASVTDGKLELRKEKSSFVKLLKETVGQSQTHASEKDLRLALSLNEKEILLYIDAQKIKEVILNYIDNAINYTPEGKIIDVKVESNKKYVELTVEDQGIGVPINEQPGLFSKSFRASNAIKFRPDGTGLGLFLAKKIIDAHGGEIIFSSKPNQGSIFGFKLPLN